MSNPKKPSLAASSSTSTPTRRQPVNAATNRASSPAPRNSSPARVLTTNGTTRTASMKSPSGVARPNRASVRRPGSIVGSIGNISAFGEAAEAQDEDARIENATTVENLRKSLHSAEVMCDEHRQQAEVLTQKMDLMLHEHARLEEQLHESTLRNDAHEARQKEDSRRVRNMASLYESERAAMLQDREEAGAREKELQATVQRLKETMAGREMRFHVAANPERRSSRSGRSHSRSSSVDANAQFAPSLQRQGSSARRQDSRSATRVATQKDMVIEGLRLELAEAQIKLVEMENMGGDRVQDLEKALLEARMTNARLMEDNESYQLLLGEKTINGDITKADFMQQSGDTAGGLGSLAEELESAEGESENYRRLEAETRSLKDQNKALTLYVEKIISRVLQHDNYENILSEKSGAEKDAPPPPPPKDDAATPSIVKRAMSVVGPRHPRPSSIVASSNHTSSPGPSEGTAPLKPRPASQTFTQFPPQPHLPTAHEDPTTAPSIPLGRSASVSARGAATRGHRRNASERSIDGSSAGLSAGPLAGPSAGPARGPAAAPSPAAALVNQMFRPPSGPVRPLSPGSPSTTATRSYFSPQPLASGGTTPATQPSSSSAGAGRRTMSGLRTASSTSAGRPPTRGSDRSSLASRESGGGGPSGGGVGESPPRNQAGNTVFTGAVMTQSRLRPLRLVQENPGDAKAEQEATRKRANRQSWLGWFNKKDEGGGPA